MFAHGILRSGRQSAESPPHLLNPASADTDTPLRCNDIAPLTIRIFYQRDIGGAVGIIFDTLNGTRNPILIAREIDYTITLLMSAGMPGSDMAVVIATTGFTLLLEQWRVGGTLMQIPGPPP